MKNMTKVLTAAAVLAVALSLAAPVGAACGATSIISTIASDGNSPIFNQEFANHPSFYFDPAYGSATVYSDDAGNPVPQPLSPAASISFWNLGTGDPRVGYGDDNADYDMIAAGGFYAYGYVNAAYPGGYQYAGSINGTWEGSGDGCVTNDGCMCLLITDQDGANGYFAALGAQAQTVSTFMNVGASPANEAIILQAIPAPVITGSVRDVATNNVTLTVNLPAPAAGDYSQDGCGCGPVGYKVLQAKVLRLDAPPSNRDLAQGGWSELTLPDGTTPQGVTPFGGAGVDLSSNCGATDEDVYVTTQLVFDSGFATDVVSENSLRIECGPNLANPSDDRPRPGSDRPGRDRPRGRKR
jgi:hypothetical protein